jgi:TolB-like protein
MSKVRFGPFCLDFERRELLRDDAVVALGSRAVDVLCALVAAKGDLVTKDELMDLVWPGLTVEENNLQVQISALRKALETGKRGQSYIVTVPSRGYRFIGLTASPGPRLSDARSDKDREPPDKPSIAVLPFENLGGDPEQEYFADGLAEDLITDLSQVTGLFVIARNSSFAYRGKSVDVRTIARSLGVRYVLEGSARRAAGRVRINVQLIDAIDSGLLWAERFDRSLDDVFKVQDEVTAKIVEALVGRLRAMQLPERKKPRNLEAYDLCLRGRALFLQSPQAAREARLMFERAIALDAEFAEPHRWLAFSLSTAWLLMGEPKEPNHRLAFAAVQKALALDPNDAGTRWVHGILLTHDRRWAEAEAEFAISLKLDPNNADAWAMFSELMVCSGRATEALADIQKALRLNPHPPGWYYWFLGQAQYLDRQYDRAVQSLRREETYRSPSRRTLAASLAQLGRLDEARQEAEMFMGSNPHFTIRGWIQSQGFRDEAALQHFIDGYRKAGLPE